MNLSYLKLGSRYRYAKFFIAYKEHSLAVFPVHPFIDSTGPKIMATATIKALNGLMLSFCITFVCTGSSQKIICLLSIR